MKEVIFVGGTSRSGSTLLNLILGNDVDGLCLGEVQAAFRPVRKHHHQFQDQVSALDPPWPSILLDSSANLYLNVFKSFANLKFIVDSSKHVIWISQQNKRCERLNLPARNVLIYKTPFELAASYRKRGMNWERPFVEYHRKYISFIDEFYLISYKDLVTDPTTLKTLCEYLSISYSPNKMNYWDSKGSIFFGSQTPTKRKSISYDDEVDKEVIKDVNRSMERNNKIKEVWDFLDAHKNLVIRKKEVAASKFSYSAFWKWVLNVKYEFDGIKGRVQPSEIIQIK
jgi:hypothetical protein